MNNMRDDKTKGEKIVELLCEGLNQRQTAEELGITIRDFQKHLDYIRRKALLPWRTKVYKAHKDDIAKNIEKWKEYCIHAEEMHKAYIQSLTKFGY